MREFGKYFYKEPGLNAARPDAKTAFLTSTPTVEILAELIRRGLGLMAAGSPNRAVIPDIGSIRFGSPHALLHHYLELDARLSLNMFDKETNLRKIDYPKGEFKDFKCLEILN